MGGWALGWWVRSSNWIKALSPIYFYSIHLWSDLGHCLSSAGLNIDYESSCRLTPV